MTFSAIIPARFGSSRFPGKPLALLCGTPVIWHVYQQVSKAIDDVYVATDDERIFNIVTEFGGKVVMTSANHRSGTDRIIEAVEKLDCQSDVIINVQGDEPFIAPSQIETLKSIFVGNPSTEIATLGKRFDTIEAAENPNSPKIAVAKDGRALYFSRSVIPYIRGEERHNWLSHYPFLKHIGIYAYRRDVLLRIKHLDASPLEIAESLEQLRWLENEMIIRVGLTDSETIGIDTPDDLARAEEYFVKIQNSR